MIIDAECDCCSVVERSRREEACALLRHWPEDDASEMHVSGAAARGYDAPAILNAWLALVEAPDYGVSRDCLGSLKAMLSSPQWNARMRKGGFGRYVSLGGGGAPRKDRSLLAAIGAARARQGRPFVALFDASADMLGLSRRAVMRVSDRIARLEFIGGDFMLPGALGVVPKATGPTMWLLSGNTLGNLDEAAFAQAMDAAAQPGDWLALGVDMRDRYDSGGQEAGLAAAYGSHRCRRLIGLLARRDGRDAVVRVVEASEARLSAIPGSLSVVLSWPDGPSLHSNRYDSNVFRAWWLKRGWREVAAFKGESGGSYQQVLLERM